MNINLQVKKNWYVLYTLPNYEKKVHVSLTKKQVTTFLPLQKVVRKWSDRRKVVEVPLFPNYLFVHTCDTKRFDVLNIYGVKNYITSGKRPVMLSEDEISRIKKMMECARVDTEGDFQKGDYVQITSGPFKGMEGVLFEKRGRARFAVRIESINQTLSIDICTSWIKEISNYANSNVAMSISS